MKRTPTALLALGLISLCPLSASAAVDTYDVDLSGVAGGSGHTLRVFGTVTLDADLAVGSAIQSSSLQFQHESDPALALPSIPDYLGSVGTEMDWVRDGDDLYITRLSSVGVAMQWFNSGFGTIGFTLASGTNVHGLNFSELSDIDEVTLKAPSGPDGPNGFLVGTAVPEPGSLALLGLGGLAVLRRRR